MPTTLRSGLSAALAAAFLGASSPAWSDDAQALTVSRLDAGLQRLVSTTQMILGSPDPSSRKASVSTPLQHWWLEVSLNGERYSDLLEVDVSTGADGRRSLSVALSDWHALGLVANPDEVNDQRRVEVSHLRNVRAVLEEDRQRLALVLPAERFLGHAVDVLGQPTFRPDTSSLSSTVNYDVFVQHARPPFASGASTEFAGLLDGRLAFDWGSFSQSLSSQIPTAGGNSSVRRLDTSYKHYDPVDLTSWQVGDAVSAGLSSRPAVRFGGVQWRRNFSLRPDLVTFPTPSINGSSAVPTSVDVYIDQIRRSQLDVAPGPFTLNQLPVLTGPSQVQVVVRDALGRDQVTTLNLFTSPELLKPGLIDFSLQAGFSRRNYAQINDHYDKDPLAIGSVRVGLNPEVTLEGQGEWGRGVQLLSTGMASLIGHDGSFGIDLAGSYYQGHLGGEVNGRFDYYVGKRLIFNGSFSEASTYFRDISSLDNGQGLTRSRQQLALSQGFDSGGTLGLSLIRQRTMDDVSFSSLMVSASHNIGARGYASLSGWRSLAQDDSWGASIGFNWFFGDRLSSSAYYEVNNTGSTGVVTAQSNLPVDSGWGWRADVAEGQHQYRRAELLNRNRISDISALVEDGESGQIARLGMVGALAWMPGTLQAGRYINDAFALVDIGYPDVAIFLENRPIGRTDAKGFLLVNDLNAYQPNKISLESLDLPLDVAISDAERSVVPGRESGVRVNFDVERNRETLLALKRSDGAWYPLGSRLLLPGGDQRVMGHDGQVLIPASLSGQIIEVLSESSRCALKLPTALQPNQQQILVLQLACP